MAANLGDYVLDNGLSALDTLVDKVTLCNAEPTNYTTANSTNVVGTKTGTAGFHYGAPAAGSPNGRKVSSASFTDGTVTSNAATASHFAALDTVNSRLLVVGVLSSSQTVYTANPWGLPSYDVRIPNQ